MKLEYKIDLLTSKLSYLRKDREYCQEVTKEAMTEFHAEFMRLISDLSKHQKELIYKFMNNNIAQPQNPLGEVESQNKETPESIKKVFKEIAKKTHPDLTGEENTELFQKAQNAVDTHSYSEILEIAEGLDIPPPEPTREDVRLLEREIISVNREIKKIKETYAWTWYHSSNKDSVMERYIVKITNMCAGA
jgi:hypothetical protein